MTQHSERSAINHLIRLCVFIISIAFVQLTLAEAPADSQIRNALSYIEKYEHQFQGQTQISKPTATRTLKLLNIARQNLDASGNKSHTSWQSADQRLNNLVSRIKMLSGGSPSNRSAPAPKEVANQAKASQSAAVQANSTQQQPRQQPRQQSQNTQMISHQRVQLRKLNRDINSAISTIDQNGPKPYQSSGYVKQRADRLNFFKQSLTRFANFPTDPDYLTAQQAIANYENMHNFGIQHAQKELQSLGDVQARLQAMSDALVKVAGPPIYPYTESSINDWISALARTRNTAEKALPYLSDIAQRAYLPNTPATRSQGADFDANDVNSLIRHYQQSIRDVDQNLETFKANIDTQVNHLSSTLNYFNSLDPANSNDQIKGFLGKGSEEESLKRLAETRQLAASAVAFSSLLKRAELAQHQQVLNQVEQTTQIYKANRQKAMNLVRMPEPASRDKNLLNIAKETLENPQYEIGDLKRLVINSDKNHYEKETSEDRYDKADISLSGDITLTGTRTTYFYEWDQFQVATAERESSGKHYIYYSTLKFFTKGAPTTPLNRWIVSGRIQGSEIPEENIDK